MSETAPLNAPREEPVLEQESQVSKRLIVVHARGLVTYEHHIRLAHKVSFPARKGIDGETMPHVSVPSFPLVPSKSQDRLSKRKS